MTVKEYLINLKKLFDDAYRFGGEVDIPEGNKYIKITDTLAKHISKDLDAIIKINTATDYKKINLISI